MVKLIVVILSVLLSFSAAFSRPANNDSIGSTEEVLSIEEATLCISFEHHKMQDDWTPVVLSIGELNCLLWMNKDGKISEMQKSGFSLIGSVCEIDVSSKSLRKEAGVLLFDVYEQNNIRTRWRLLTDRLKGTIPAKILFSKKSGIELDLGTVRLQLKHAAWDIEEFSPGLYRVQFHSPMMILSRPMVYEKTAGKLYSDHEWRNKLTHQQNQKRPQVAGRKTLAAAAIPSLERATLIALYNSTNGDNWNNNSGWKTPPLAADGFALPGTENTWYGIECDPGNTIVQRIDLSYNNLYGTLPPELGKLANLQYLNLCWNQLSGPIPRELEKLANLQELYFDSNKLSGPIPPELVYLANLQCLNLCWNQLNGSIPREIGNMANLQYLDLDSNQLSGSIPQELGKLANLQYLDLYGNQLSGSIPLELGKLANLQNLILDGNQLSGPIPPELGNLDNLQLLNISNNQLSGPIPPELGKLANLKELHLFGNELSSIIPPELGKMAKLESIDFTYNQLSGPIPPELGNLANLKYLDLWGNQLSGPIPPELGNLANLQYLLLERNQLSGPIPPQLDKLVNLQYLYLRSNQLSGSIPPELGKLDNLKYLDLWGNQLSGSIPPELGILANLQYLDLATNQLSGLIPPELGNLADLQYLLLWSNQLSGIIPPELGNLANLKYLNLSWNQLSGPIPPELGNLANLQKLYLRSTQLSGSIPPELGNLANLIYLNLSLNRLSGPIPPELGNLANLQYLRLYGNRLSGSIPFNLTNMANLKDNDGLDLRWNALYTHDDKLRDFLNSKQYGKDWESSQTIAPSDVNANPVSISAITIDWTPIAYKWDTGGYRVFYSTNHSEPYTYAGMTADKLASSFTVTKLNSGVTYYFVVQTRTDPHEYNQNTVDSEYSAEVSAVTSPIILTSPNGGESWSLHTIRNITWTSGKLAGNIRLELWKAGKKLGTIAAGIPIINHTYAWPVGNYGQGIALPGNDYKVKIITANGLYNDISDKVFSIVQSSLTLTSPRSNDSLKLGTLKNITWRSLGLTGNVKLLLFKNGVQIGVIAWGIPVTNGTYTWTVGKNSSGMAPTGSNYTVKIRSEDNPSYCSGSGIFNIL